jgi:hypothetical protein
MEENAQEVFNAPNSTSITVTARGREITPPPPREAGMLVTIRTNLTTWAESREMLQSVQDLLRDESRFKNEIEPLLLKRTSSESTLMGHSVSIVSVGNIRCAGACTVSVGDIRDDDDDDEKQRVRYTISYYS